MRTHTLGNAGERQYPPSDTRVFLLGGQFSQSHGVGIHRAGTRLNPNSLPSCQRREDVASSCRQCRLREARALCRKERGSAGRLDSVSEVALGRGRQFVHRFLDTLEEALVGGGVESDALALSFEEARIGGRQDMVRIV